MMHARRAPALPRWPTLPADNAQLATPAAVSGAICAQSSACSSNSTMPATSNTHTTPLTPSAVFQQQPHEKTPRTTPQGVESSP